MPKERGLGRAAKSRSTKSGGMSVLINSLNRKEVRFGASELLQLDISTIEPNPFQPRKTFPEDTLRELADSIISEGVIQPIIVRRGKNKRYQIVAGERRWRAVGIAGITTIPAVIKQVSDNDSAAHAIIENLQREELNAIEEARALKNLADNHGATHEGIARIIGKSRSAVTNTLRLLTLHDDVQTYLADSLLDQGHARALIPLPKNHQIRIAKDVVRLKLNARDVERIAKKILNRPPDILTTAKQANGAAGSNTAGTQEAKRIAKELSDALGHKVTIKHDATFKGSVSFHFTNNDSFVALMKKLGIKKYIF